MNNKLNFDDFTRVNNDTNGNPRYVTHYLNCRPECYAIDLDISDQYRATCALMNRIGGKKYHNKSFGGGIVFQSYNLERTIEHIQDLIKEEQSQWNNLADTRQYYKFERLILDSAYNEGFEECEYYTEFKNDKDIATFIYGRFRSEYGWNITSKGELGALVDWLQGLALNIPYMNAEILKLFEVQDASEKKQEKILANYWEFMSMRLLGIWRYFGIAE